MIALSIALVLIAFLVCVTVVGVLDSKHDFQRETRTWKDNVALGEALEKRLKEFDELKAKVDGLALRVGIR